MFLKTELCRFHAEGKCVKGEACSFAHGQDELRTKPDLTKTTLCVRWQKDFCGRNDCPYAHGPDDLRHQDSDDESCAEELNAARQIKPRQLATRTVDKAGDEDPNMDAATDVLRERALLYRPWFDTGGSIDESLHCSRCLREGFCPGAAFCAWCGCALAWTLEDICRSAACDAWIQPSGIVLGHGMVNAVDVAGLISGGAQFRIQTDWSSTLADPLPPWWDGGCGSSDDTTSRVLNALLEPSESKDRKADEA